MRGVLQTRQASRDRDAPPRGREGDAQHRTPDGHEVRRRADAAARLRAFGRARLDAGHDGHDPQPRHERPGRGGRFETHGQSALRMGLVPPFRADVRRRGAGHEARLEGGPRSVRGDHRRAEGQARREERHGPDHRRPEGTGTELQGGREAADRRGFPRLPLGAAVGRRVRRVRLVDERARHPLPQAQQHPRRVGNGRFGAGDGLRQHGRELGHGRGFLARRRDGREHLQRRVPDQCAGRGRRGRYPHPAADHDRRLEALGQGAEHSGGGARREIPLARGGDARGLQGAGRDSAPPRAVLQGHAGHRVHDPGRQALDAPVPQRQAHGRGDGQDRHGHAARGADRRKDRRAALRTREARRAAAPRIRQEGHRFGTGHHEGAARLAGRGDGSRGVLRRGRREGAGQDGPEGDPGAHRDLARGPEGHARRGRNPHGARRHDLARGRRGARHGQMLRLGRRRAGDRLQGPHDQGERLHGQGGRLDLAQRLDGRGLSGSGGHEGRRPERRLRQARWSWPGSTPC